MADIVNPTTESKSNGFDKLLGSAGGALKVANGVAGLVDGIFGISAKRQEKAQQRLMDKQQDQWKEQQSVLNDYMLAQWNRENEFNDPTNYYKRLLDGADANGISKAGVLGNMPSGNVGVSASKNTAGGNVGTGVGSPSALGLGDSSSLAGLRQRAEIENIESQTTRNLAEAGLSEARITTEQLQWNIQQSIYKLNNNLADLYVKDGKLKDSLVTYQDKVNSVFDVRNAAELDSIRAGIFESFGNFVKSISDASLTPQRRKALEQEVSQSVAQTALIYAWKKEVELNSWFNETLQNYVGSSPELQKEFKEALFDMYRMATRAYKWTPAMNVSKIFGEIGGVLSDLVIGTFKGVKSLSGSHKTHSSVETYVDPWGQVIGSKQVNSTDVIK